MTKKDLKNGMIVRLSDNAVGVVVNNKIILQNGCYVNLEDIEEDLTCYIDDLAIDYIFECDCFFDANNEHLIWKREENLITDFPLLMSL